MSPVAIHGRSLGGVSEPLRSHGPFLYRSIAVPADHCPVFDLQIVVVSIRIGHFQGTVAPLQVPHQGDDVQVPLP